MRVFPALVVTFGLAFAFVPVKADDIWFPVLDRNVVDREGVLPPATETFLSAIFDAHERQTTNQVAVVTFPTLGGLGIDDFSHRLVRHWGLGHGDRGNGVVLVVNPKSREAGIGVGEGLADTLSDAVAGTIVNQYVMPKLREGDIAGGVTTGAREIMDVLSGEAIGTVHELPSPEQNREKTVWALGVIVACGLLLMVLRILSRGWTDYERLSRLFSAAGQRAELRPGGGFFHFAKPDEHPPTDDAATDDAEKQKGQSEGRPKGRPLE